MKKPVLALITIIGLGLVGGIFWWQFSGHQQSQVPTPVGPSVLKTKPVDLTSVSFKKENFANYYVKEGMNVSLKVPGYPLPLSLKNISNLSKFCSKIPLSNKAKNLISQNGFAVINFDKKDDIAQAYNDLKNVDVPIFITTDSLLHLYHVQFDESLREIEEKEFYNDIWQLSEKLLNASFTDYQNSSGKFKEAAKRNIAFLSVGLELLKPKAQQICRPKNEWDKSCRNDFQKKDLQKYRFDIPNFVKVKAEEEINLIKRHKGFANSPIFIYKEDYSQYVPRGHYTRSAKLKNYFKAMMWYGKMTMLLKGDRHIPIGKSCQDCKALISKYDSEVQTLQALLLTNYFVKTKETQGLWNRVYTVTAFYVGFSDDLGCYEYLKAINNIFGESFNINNIEKDDNFLKLEAEFLKLRSPKIYGGTGNAALIVRPGESIASLTKKVNELLEKTKGFRLMGQRFIPDAYAFSELTNKAGGYVGRKECSNIFTCVVSDMGPTRGFPRGLDIMALLGSKRARYWLKTLEDNNYQGYQKVYSDLENKFNKFTLADWQKNLYWSWLYSLKPLLKDFGRGYQTFMQTDAWKDKELNAALSSWAELRHDTILYAKQSHTAFIVTSMPMPQPQPIIGYVEPVPEFYNRLLALTQVTKAGLSKMNVLDDVQKSRLKNLEQILGRLREISIKELGNEELSKEDYNFIKHFGNRLDGVISNLSERAKQTTIVADVHTDTNSRQVLEEGIGYLKLIIAAYKVPDGRILIGAGPVFSYYEFKQPMANRLTDENWQKMLKTNTPSEPEWAHSYSAY